MENIVILGKSSFAIGVIVDILKLNYDALSTVQIISNIEDEKNESLGYDYKVSGVGLIEKNQTEWTPNLNDKYIIGSIGKSRKNIFEYFKDKFDIQKDRYLDVIHPSSVLGSGMKMGKGTHVSPLSVVAPFTKFGDFVVINRHVNIGHHVVLGDYVGINPGVTISGLCKIGANSIIGSGATILDGIKIGENVKIGAGSVVTKDIPDNVIAYGVPAKVIREVTH